MEGHTAASLGVDINLSTMYVQIYLDSVDDFPPASSPKTLGNSSPSSSQHCRRLPSILFNNTGGNSSSPSHRPCQRLPEVFSTNSVVPAAVPSQEEAKAGGARHRRHTTHRAGRRRAAGQVHALLPGVRQGVQARRQPADAHARARRRVQEQRGAGEPGQGGRTRRRVGFDDESTTASIKSYYSCPHEGCRWNRKHAKFQPLKSVICAKNHYKRSHSSKMYVCYRCNHNASTSPCSPTSAPTRSTAATTTRSTAATTVGSAPAAPPSPARTSSSDTSRSIFTGHQPVVPLERLLAGGQAAANGCGASGTRIQFIFDGINNFQRLFGAAQNKPIIFDGFRWLPKLVYYFRRPGSP